MPSFFVTHYGCASSTLSTKCTGLTKRFIKNVPLTLVGAVIFWTTVLSVTSRTWKRVSSL